MFGNMTPQQMAMLAMGAGMMDPTGTYGSAGAALNKGLQAGMKTYFPMAQWEYQKQRDKEKSDYQKEQDMLRNVLLERQFKLSQQTEARLGEQAAATARYNNARIGIENKKLQMETDALEQQQKYISQFTDYAVNGIPNPAAAAAAGPRVGNDPATSLPPGMQARVPMTPQQFGAMGAAAQVAGVPSGAVKSLGDAAFPSTQFGPNFSPGDHKVMLLYKEANNTITPQERKVLEEMKNSDPTGMKALAQSIARGVK